VETLSFYAMVKRLNLCDEIIDERNKRSFIWSLKKRIVGKRQRLNKWIIHNIYPDSVKFLNVTQLSGMNLNINVRVLCRCRIFKRKEPEKNKKNMSEIFI
jgi:hypothetical protein